MNVLRAAAAFAASLCLCGAVAYADAGWSTLSPSGGQFTVNLPPQCTPKLSDQKDKGSHTLMWSCSSQGSWVYLIGYTDYARIDDVRAELNADRDNFDNGVKATEDAQQDITTDGVSGIEFTSHSTRANFHARVWVRGNRAYMVAVGGVGGVPAEGMSFLNSFHFTND